MPNSRQGSSRTDPAVLYGYLRGSEVTVLVHEKKFDFLEHSLLLFASSATVDEIFAVSRRSRSGFSNLDQKLGGVRCGVRGAVGT
jgi:hypothetical protein